MSTGSNTPRTPLGSPPPNTPTTPKQTYTGPPLGRYQSRFKNNSEPIEEKILNRIIRLKLNKFGPTTYTEIRDFLFQILGQESISTEENEEVKAEEGQVAEFVKDFMLMVFKKAASEEIYCPLYAKLLSEIGSKHSVIFEEMNSLYVNFMAIFEEADVNVASGDMASFEKKNVEKKYRQGYSQFIAELTTLEILPIGSLVSTFTTLFQQIDKHGRTSENKPLIEEYVDCLLRMSKVMKDKPSTFFCTARSKLFQQNKEIIDNLINIRDGTYPSLSPKARFLLMDIRDIINT
jgi:thiol-disulfide isomerase/thioredoxin